MTNLPLTFVALGRPAPQGSKDRGSAGQMREASRFLPIWRKTVTLAAMRARKLSGHETFVGPVKVSMDFLLRRPAAPADLNFPIGPPDADKLARAVCDCLTKAGVYSDDARVVDLHVRKAWASSERTGVVVTVARIIPDDPS